MKKSCKPRGMSLHFKQHQPQFCLLLVFFIAVKIYDPNPAQIKFHPEGWNSDFGLKSNSQYLPTNQIPTSYPVLELLTFLFAQAVRRYVVVHCLPDQDSNASRFR